MKRFIQLTTLILIVFMVASCKKDTRSLNTNVSAVSSLSAPANQAALNLQPGGIGVTFNWATATADEGGVVLYEVAFDKENGDFKTPVYKILSDGNGVQTQATIPQDTLNKIASIAGIASSTTGILKWAVISSKASNAKLSTQINKIQVTRPAGFAVLPTKLYLTGSATEAGGSDVSKAIAFKQTETGVFELYTALKPGTYHLTDKADASGTTYYIDGNGTIKAGSESTTVTDAEVAYRLRFNFNVATSNIVKIQSVGLYMSAYGNEIGQLSYTGNSIWENPKIPVVFYQFSWGRDERYKFVLHTSNGLEYYGSSNQNNVAPAGQPASYFYLVPVNNSQWDFTYKFDPSIDNHNAKVTVNFKTSGAYTHSATAVN